MQEPALMGCRNSEDPFTLDSLEGLESRRIINIERDCFDLKPLFNWVYNQEKFTNPLTNLPFSDQNLNRIKNAALQRFPCEVEVDEISIKTTTLSNYQRVFINVMKKLSPGNRISTLYDAMMDSVNTLQIAFRVSVDLGVDGVLRADLAAFLLAEMKNTTLGTGDEPLLGRLVKFEKVYIGDVPGYVEQMRKVMSLIGYSGSNLREARNAPQRMQRVEARPAPARPVNLKLTIQTEAVLKTYKGSSLFGTPLNPNLPNEVKLTYNFEVKDNLTINERTSLRGVVQLLKVSFSEFVRKAFDLRVEQADMDVMLFFNDLSTHNDLFKSISDFIKGSRGNFDPSSVYSFSAKLNCEERALRPSFSPIRPNNRGNNNNLDSPRSPDSPYVRNFEPFDGPNLPELESQQNVNELLSGSSFDSSSNFII